MKAIVIWKQSEDTIVHYALQFFALVCIWVQASDNARRKV